MPDARFPAVDTNRPAGEGGRARTRRMTSSDARVGRSVSGTEPRILDGVSRILRVDVRPDELLKPLKSRAVAK